jgi:hypothetical protein
MRSVSKRVSSSRDISILTTYSSRAITHAPNFFLAARRRLDVRCLSSS